ncbi:MAG: nucleotidyltransferase domain-containing protein [Armatimonadota bacterium]
MRVASADNIVGSAPGTIAKVVQQLVQRFAPRKVILFGSYAYGEPTLDSDIDLLVVMDNPPDPKAVWGSLRDIRRSSEVCLQILFMSTNEFEETKEVVGGIAYPAHHWGKVLYESEP